MNDSPRGNHSLYVSLRPAQRLRVQRDFVVAAAVPRQGLAVLRQRAAVHHDTQLAARREVGRQRPAPRGRAGTGRGRGRLQQLLAAPVGADVDHAVDPYRAQRLGMGHVAGDRTDVHAAAPVLGGGQQRVEQIDHPAALACGGVEPGRVGRELGERQVLRVAARAGCHHAGPHAARDEEARCGGRLVVRVAERVGGGPHGGLSELRAD
ncbi:conserved hypothetical protein, partial [Ricinus communis]